MRELERAALRVFLRRALTNDLAPGWLYLAEFPPASLDEICLLYADDLDEEEDDSDIPAVAISAGFPQEGLSQQDLASVTKWVRQFEDPPSDDLLFESYVYYLRFDAFLPEPGAKDPLPEAEARVLREREFYDALGAETSEEKSREPGCVSRALRFGVLCRAHHFENVTKRPCPFED